MSNKSSAPKTIKVKVSDDIGCTADYNDWIDFAKQRSIPTLPGQTTVYVKGLTLLDFVDFCDARAEALAKLARPRLSKKAGYMRRYARASGR